MFHVVILNLALNIWKCMRGQRLPVSWTEQELTL